MKPFALMFAVLFAFTGIANAQENTGVKKETVTKRVTTRDTKVETKVINEIDEEKSVLVIEGNDKKEQNSTMVTKKEDKVEVVSDVVDVDAKNAALQAEIAAKKKAELEASIAAEKAKAEKERMILEQNKAKMQKELEARRAALESRPKGMSKLSKKDN